MFTLFGRMSVRNRIWSILLIFMGTVVIGGAVDVLMLRKTLQQEKEAAIRQLVESGFSVLAHYEELQRSGTLTREAAQAAAISTVKGMRYNGKEYFWINDDQTPARMIMHPLRPELDGQALTGQEFNCVTGQRSGLEGPFIATDGKKNLTLAFAEVVAQSGQGYVTYQWPRSTDLGGTTGRLFPKLSYVKKFTLWGWIIGSGIYVDDIDALVRARATENLLWLLGLSTLLLLLASLMARSITGPLQNTMRTMRGIAKGTTGLGQRVGLDGPSEIAELAGNFNEMLSRIEARDQALLDHQENLEKEVASRTASLREANCQLDADLLERIRIEKVIREGRNRMHALLDASDESVMLLAPDGKVLEINNFAAKRFGQIPREMIGKNFFGLLPEALAESRRAMFHMVGENGEAVRFQDQRGAIFFDNSLYPVKDDAGVVESVAVYAKDVSEQHRIKLEEELFQHLGTVLMRWGIDSATVAQIYCDSILPVYGLCAAGMVVVGENGGYKWLAGSPGVMASTVEQLTFAGAEGGECRQVASVIESGQRALCHFAPSAEAARRLGAGVAIMLPLILHDHCWGVVVLYGAEPTQFAEGLAQQRLIASISRLVATLESALRQERLALLDLALSEVGNAVMICDAQPKIVWVNRSFCKLSGYAMEEILGKAPNLFESAVSDAAGDRSSWQSLAAGESWRGEIVNRRQDGSQYTANQMVTPLFNLDGTVSHYVAILEDISERKRQEIELQENYARVRALNEQLENAQNQLLQAEKMASIGQLAAGVAHEINNPIGFVNSNLGTLKTYVDELLGIIQAYTKADPLLVERPELLSAIRALKERADLDFLSEDIHLLLKESSQGIGRVTKIVQDLKDFSRVDSLDWGLVDLELALNSTLNIVANEIRDKADIVREYGRIPSVECLGSQMNQVFMNLLINAAQAIESHGTITIRTGTDEANVWVEIADTGKGIPAEFQKRIFEPFFTTQAVGKGIGLGLSLAYSIVQKHHGKLEVTSQVGAGSCFRVEIPCRQPNGQLAARHPNPVAEALA